MKDVIIYTDGACRGNPGTGGWGVLMSYQEEVKELYGGELDTTNNKMELRAVIEGLNTLKIIYNQISSSEIKMPLVSAIHEILFNNGSKELLLEQIINSEIYVDVNFDVES